MSVPYSRCPAVGDVVIPAADLDWGRRDVPCVPHRVVELHDYGPQGLDEVILIVVDERACRYYDDHGMGVPPYETSPRLSWTDVRPSSPRSATPLAHPLHLRPLPDCRGGG